jgi:hypothetical protein
MLRLRRPASLPSKSFSPVDLAGTNVLAQRVEKAVKKQRVTKATPVSEEEHSAEEDKAGDSHDEEFHDSVTHQTESSAEE